MTEQTTRPPQPPQGSVAVRILKWAGIVVGSIVLLLTAVLLWPGTRQWAFDYGRAILAEAGVQSASITGSWSEMTLSEVALTDDDGTWATAREIVISWSPLGLLSGNIIADRIELHGGHVYREPKYKPAADQADEPFAWPDLPVDIDAQSLTGDVTIDPAVIGEAITATLNGKAALTSGGGNAELAVVRSDGIAGEASVTARSTADLSDIEIAVNAKDARVAALLAGDDRLRNLQVAFQAMRKDLTCGGQAAISARDGALVSVGVNPDCTFAVTLTDVARLLDPSAGLTGPANVTVQLREDGTDKTTNFVIAADLSKIQSTDAMLARLLPGASVNGLVIVVAGGARLDNLQGQLAAGKIAFTGNAAVGTGIRANLDLNASDLTVLRPDLEGQMQARVVYDTAAATPIQIEAKASNVAAGGYSWRAITLSGSVDPAGSGLVVLKSDGGGDTPIDLTVNVADAFTALKADAKGSVAGASIDARATQAGSAYDIAATIDAQQIDKLGALAGIDVSGALKADISGRFGMLAGAIKLKASISRGRYGATEIGEATLEANGPLNALVIDLKGRAPLPPRAVDYAIAATVRDFNSAAVSSLSVKSGTESLSTTQPFTVAFTNGVVIDGLDARFFRNGAEAGRIAATASQSSNGARTSVRVTSVNLEAIAGLAGIAPLKGTLNATAELDGGAGRASLDGTIAGLRATGAAGRAPPADVGFKGNWNGGQFRLTATATAQGLPGASADIAFPLARAADGGFPSPSPNAPLTGRISWTGRLAPLWRLADIDGQDLDGDADIQATLAGTISKPRFDGTVTLANGVYSNDLSGTRLAALNLQARASDDTITVTGSATDGARGSMEVNFTIRGTGGIGGVSGGVSLHKMQLLARDDVSGRVDGSLRLERNAAGPVLVGELTVLDLNASIPSPGPPDLVVVDVIDPAKPPKPRKAAPAAAVESPAPAEVLALAVDVLIPGPARVEGRGVESLWRGKLDVTGDASDPRLSGKLTLMRGTLAFGSRSFTLSEGEITFDGGPTIEPRIKIVATQTEADFTASITLSGRAAQPDLSVSSVPAAPQDEVFARLLFGRSVTNISPLEALELANSIAALSGSGSAGGVLSNLRDRFGLDVLAVDVGENGQIGVKAGTYISRNVYFELRQGGDSAGAKGRLEIQIDENISVETEVGADSSSSVGARYKIDY
ncbi:MAG: translocation/assembly module TamB domain-containing protein [Alphaproteobacteria bacterium]|nr:translocation/assembly module TamB domain-containing protein [Alphaproteobacteria bacterium]